MFSRETPRHSDFKRGARRSPGRTPCAPVPPPEHGVTFAHSGRGAAVPYCAERNARNDRRPRGLPEAAPTGVGSLPVAFTCPQESPAGAKTSWGASRRRRPGPPWPRSATELGSFRGNFVVKLGSSAHCQACRHRHLEAARGKSGDRNERPPICLPRRWLACRKTVGLSLQAE